MAIVTNVPSDNVVPQTFHSFNYLRNAGSLINIPLTVAIIATKSAAGTGAVGVVFDVTESSQSDGLAGANSEAAMMCRQAFLTARLLNRGPRVKLTLINAPAGTARVQTITAVGTATSDGNQIIKVSGRTFVVGVRAGDVQNTNATAIANALKSRAEELPVIVTVATNVVTLTHPHAGVNGQDVEVVVDQQVAGVVATVAQTTAGTGAADITPGLTALSPVRYDGISIANHTTTDITAVKLDLATRWGVESKTWGWYFVWESGTIGTATTLAAAANDRAIIIGNMEGCRNSAGEGAVTAAMLVFSRELARASFDGATVPLFPPNAALLYTGPEKNTAIKAGIAAFTGIIDSAGNLTDGRAACVQMVTSKTTIGTAPDDRNRDIAVSRVGVHLALQLDFAAQDTLGPDRNPDGVTQEDATALLGDLSAAIIRAEARAGNLRKDTVEDDVGGTVIEEDATVLGRNNVLLTYHPALPLHQVAFAHNIVVGIGGS